MASKLVQSVPPLIKPLAAALGDGHRYRPGEMFRFFLSAVMQLWGFQPWYPVPDDCRGKIVDAIGEYDKAIAAAEPFQDILGVLYQALASHGGKQLLGQYFTPWNLAVMMARMNGSDDQPSTSGGLKRVSDPACGSGVLLLAKANHLLETKGPDELRNWILFGCDLDAICTRMAAVQIASNCASWRLELGEIVILEGDSISNSAKQVILHASAPSRIAMAS